MSDKIRLLLACSDPESRAHIAESLNGTEFTPILASSFAESCSVLEKQPVSMVFCEDQLPGGGFPRVLEEVKHAGVNTPVVVLSRTGDWEEYLAALRLGAFDMVIPPYERSAIHTIAYRALHESRISRGAPGAEALPRMAPRAALRPAAAARAASAGQNPVSRAAQNDSLPGRKLAAGTLPGEEKTGAGDEKLSGSDSLAKSQRAVSGDGPLLGNREMDRSVSNKRGG